MKRTIAMIAAVLSAGIIAAGCSSVETSSTSETAEPCLTLSDLTDLNGGSVPDIEYYYGTDRVRQIDGRVSGRQVHSEDDALTVIKELENIIGCNTTAGELRFRVRNPGDPGYIYVFDQYYEGVPVDGSVALSVDENGDTTRLLNRFVTGIDIDTKPGISAEEAASDAAGKYGCETVGEPELVIICMDGGAHLTWDVKLKSTGYPDEVFIDAENGSILAENGPIS